MRMVAHDVSVRLLVEVAKAAKSAEHRPGPPLASYSDSFHLIAGFELYAFSFQ